MRKDSFAKKLLYGFFLIGLMEVDAVMGWDNNRVDLSTYVSVPYCHLVKDSKEFNSKKVVVRASYRYGEEWQEMFALKCRDKNIWVEFEPETEDAEKAINRAVRGVPRHQGTVNATFYGIFHEKISQYAGGRYDYELKVRFVEGVEVISKEGWVPEKLSGKAQLKLCQGNELPKER